MDHVASEESLEAMGLHTTKNEVEKRNPNIAKAYNVTVDEVINTVVIILEKLPHDLATINGIYKEDTVENKHNKASFTVALTMAHNNKDTRALKNNGT